MVSTRTARPRTRARRGEGARLREEILQAATRLLVETGDEGAVSVRAVADLVGVTPPSIYLHFGDKNALIFECSQVLMGRLQGVVEAAVADIDDPADRLRAAAHTYVAFGLANPEPYRIMFMSPHHEVPADFDIATYEGTAAFAALVQLVADVLAARPGGPGGPDPAMAAMGLWSAFHGITSVMIAKAVEPIAFPWPDVTALTDHVMDVHLAALTGTHPANPEATGR